MILSGDPQRDSEIMDFKLIVDVLEDLLAVASGHEMAFLKQLGVVAAVNAYNGESENNVFQALARIKDEGPNIWVAHSELQELYDSVVSDWGGYCESAKSLFDARTAMLVGVDSRPTTLSELAEGGLVGAHDIVVTASEGFARELAGMMSVEQIPVGGLNELAQFE